jgi:hypothetical protein
VFALVAADLATNPDSFSQSGNVSPKNSANLGEKALHTKEAYYDALQRADQGWHEDRHDPKPFIKYLSGISDDR